MAIPIRQRETSLNLPSMWAAKPFPECMDKVDGRRMGPLNNRFRVKNPFSHSPPVVSKPVAKYNRVQSPITTGIHHHRTRNHATPVKESNRTSTKFIYRLPLPTLYHSKEDRRSTSSTEPSATQLVHSSQTFQDGISQNRLHSNQSGRLPHQYRLRRRDPTRAGASLFPSLPLVHMGRPAVSILGTPIRSVSFTSRFHQNSSTRSSLGTTERHTARILTICWS